MRREPTDAEYENYYRNGYKYAYGYDPLEGEETVGDIDLEEEIAKEKWDRREK